MNKIKYAGYKNFFIAVLLFLPIFSQATSIESLLELDECDVSDTKGKGGTFNSDCLYKKLEKTDVKLLEIVKQLEKSDYDYSRLVDSHANYTHAYCKARLSTGSCGSSSCITVLINTCQLALKYEFIKKLACLTLNDGVNVYLDKATLEANTKLCFARLY